MNSTTTPNAPARAGKARPRKSNLLALALVFAAFAAATFGAQMALGRGPDTEVTSTDLQQARQEALAAIPRLPADTEDRLAAALYPQLAPSSGFTDPFVDRANIGGAGAGRPPIIRARAAIPVSSAPAAPAAAPSATGRLQSWQQAFKAAAAAGHLPPPITTAYLHTDVAPTGRLDMGQVRGAWFYIASEKRVFSASVGTKFYDAVFAGVTPQGVVFRLQNGTVKTVEWERADDFSTTMPSQRSADAPDVTATPQPADGDARAAGTERGGQVSSQLPEKAGAAAPATTPSDAGRFGLLQDAVRGRDQRHKGVTRPLSATGGVASTVGNAPAREIGLIAAAPVVTETPAQPEAAPEKMVTAKNPVVVAPAPVGFADAAWVSGGRDAEPWPSRAVFGPAGYREGAVSDAEFAGRGRHHTRLDLGAAGGDDGASDELKAAASPTSVAPPSSAVAATPAPSPQGTPETAGQATAARPSSPTATYAAAESAPPPPRPLSLCDSQFRGEDITITNESNRPITLLSLVNKLNDVYGANIVLDYDVQDTPVRLNLTDAPWSSVLRTLLDLNDLDVVCLDGGIVQIAKRSKIAQIDEQRRKTAPLVREVFRLRYLQPTSGGRTNLAGVTQSANGATIQSVEEAIRAILKAGGDARGETRRVPGRNEIFVAATREQMAEIRDLIGRVDRPGYQVLIKALVYTANENRLRDIGSQLSVVVGNGPGTHLGGFTTLPNSQQNNGGNSGGDGESGNGQGGLNPGGIPGLAAGMRQPTNGLGAANPAGTLGVSAIFGTTQVAYQLTLAQQKGVINIQSRPFGIVSDGDTFDLVAGTQIPVVTTTIAGGAPFQSGSVQFIEASRIARITPQVAETEDGKPGFVTLNIQLENNAVDTSLGTFNGVPGVNRQSLQTVMRLRNGETAIVGGLAADTVSNATSKVPGLGDVPLFGNLFKRKTNQENRDRLYFAITVEVISQEAQLPAVPAPADAMTSPPPPPRAQRPSPFEKR
ncbi:MAG TPA: hypothetical protein VNA89_05905 [Gemmatimonadaceae bacterium]|nr:hypothetical protein [Gemmatimonadaceae bacterium]